MASPSLNPATGVAATGTAITITSGTLTTTVANTIIVAAVYCERNTASVSSVKSVTGGLSFTRLGGRFNGTTVGVDIWYLASAGTFSDTIQATYNTAPGNAILHVFGVQGCASILSPFDPNVGLPTTATGTTSPESFTYSTTNADDLIIFASANGNISTGTATAPGIPTGFTNILTSTNALGSGSVGSRTALLSVSAPQSGASISSTIGTVGTWVAIVFAFTADAAAASSILQSQYVTPVFVPKSSVDLSQPLNPNLFTNPIPILTTDRLPATWVPKILPQPPDPLNINLFTNPFPFNQYDWNKPYFPVIRPYPQTGVNINIFTNPIPFNQTDWSKPFFPHFLPDPQIGINANIFTNPIPTLNIDARGAYPLRGTALSDQAYNQSLYTVVIVSNPFNQTDWSITARQRAQPQPDQQYNPNLFTNPIPVLNVDPPHSLAVRGASPVDSPYNQNLYTVVVTAAPFNQTDWALPIRQRPLPPADIQFNPNLLTNPIPFNQTDFSPAHRTPQAPFDLSFALNLNIFTNPIPIFNFDYTPQHKPLPVPLDPNQGFSPLYQPVVTVTLLQRTLTGVGL